MGMTVGEETAAQTTVANGDDHEILHAVGRAVGFLAKSGDMGIVSQGHGHAQTILQHGSQGDNTLPRHVGCILNTSC